MSKRKDIRQAIRARLDSALSGVNVYDYRLATLQPDKLPAVSIYISRDTAEKTQDDQGYIRIYEVDIIIQVKGKDTAFLNTGETSVDSDLDDIIEDIENEFFKLRETLSKNVFNFNYISGETKPDNSTEDFILIHKMKFEARVNQEVI